MNQEPAVEWKYQDEELESRYNRFKLLVDKSEHGLGRRDHS